MFHTVELYLEIIDYKEHYALYKALVGFSKRNRAKFHLDNQGDYIFHCFKDRGITIKLKNYAISESKNYCDISIILNPKRLICKDEYIEVTKETDLVEINKCFKQVIGELQTLYIENNGSDFFFVNYLTKIKEYDVRRIDYCINLRLEKAEEYMKLIKRADIPKKFELYTKYDKLQKRKVAPIYSFYLKSKTVVINIYLKYEHLNNDKYFIKHNFENAKGIIRFEVQCNKIKINNLVKKLNLKHKNLFALATNDISRYVIFYYLKMTLMFGNYITLREAKEVISENKTYSDQTKLEIKNIIELINEKRSIFEALKHYDGKKKEFYKFIKKIEKLDINPVTIPEGWKIKYLHSLLHIVEQEFISYYRKVIVKHL